MNYNRVPFMQTVHNSLEPWHKLYTNCTREHVHKLALKPVHKLYTGNCTQTVHFNLYKNCKLGPVHKLYARGPQCTQEPVHKLYTNCTTELVHKLLHHLNLTYTHHHVFCTMYCKKKYWYCVLKEFMLPLWYIVCMYALRCEKLKHLA